MDESISGGRLHRDVALVLYLVTAVASKLIGLQVHIRTSGAIGEGCRTV